MTHLTGSSQRISFQSIFKANISQTVETCIICTQSQLSGWLLEPIKCVAQNQMSAPAFQLQLLPLMNKYYHTFSPRLLSLQVQNCPILHNHFTCLPDCGRLLYGQLKTQLLCNSFSCSPAGGRLLTGQCASPTHAASLPSGENPTSSDFEILELFVLGNGRPLIAPQGTLTVKEYFNFAGFLTKDHTF